MPRGAKSDEAYVREVLGGLASARNLLIVNDEAHHAWRVPAESKRSKALQERIEEALQVLEQFEATTWGIALREIDGERFVVLPPGVARQLHGRLRAHGPASQRRPAAQYAQAQQQQATQAE